MEKAGKKNCGSMSFLFGADWLESVKTKKRSAWERSMCFVEGWICKLNNYILIYLASVLENNLKFEMSNSSVHRIFCLRLGLEWKFDKTKPSTKPGDFF